MLTSKQREQLRNELGERLAALYQTVKADITAAQVSAAAGREPHDEADDAVEDELATLLDEHDRVRAHQLEDALRRLDGDEDYGGCVDCGEPIPFERLRALPWAERCAADQERLEEQERAKDRMAKSGEQPVLATIAMGAFEALRDSAKVP
jgi:RNA polymerase-binding transcription factor DksA